MLFFLGTHKPNWLATADVPLFVSRRSLCDRKTLPRARGPWALDSGAFTELSQFGEFRTSAMTYSTEVRRFAVEIGQMVFAAPQDWMCEPFITAKTGESVDEHQRRTVANYLLLRQLAPDLPWVPVLQGFAYDDYLRCWDRYEAAGVRLADQPLIGLGSVCRRQDTGMVEELIRELHAAGIKLHAFGVKLLGLRRAARYLSSSDSMAWSFDARRAPPLPGHTHKSCANCMEYALRWREKALRAIRGSEGNEQCLLFDPVPTATGFAFSAPEDCAEPATSDQG